MEKNKKIALILSTNGIEYDDRIRKEMLTIMELHPGVEFKIFAIIDGENEEKEGVSDYGVNYHIFRLKSRDKYPSGSHLLKKTFDFYKVVKPHLKDFDAIWLADTQVLFFLLLCNKPKIWDLHELPTEFLGNGIMKLALKYMMNRCRAVIHANPERLKYLRSINALSNKKNQFVIRNYPNFNEADTITDELYERFVAWKGGDDCVYLQGANSILRCDKESVEAILAVEGLKAVVVGGFRNELMEELKQKYGKEFHKRLFFTGKVRQQMTPHYIRQCKFALVLYRNVRANNYYCEPNRMYQTIVNGLPVVVGCNPPMKELVEKYNFGIALDGDGSYVEQIKKGILMLLEKYDEYQTNVNINRNKLLWSQQEVVLNSIINNI